MFYFEGTSEVMCCYFAHRDGRECSGGQGLQWYTNTQWNPALVPTADFEGNWPTAAELSLQT